MRARIHLSTANSGGRNQAHAREPSFTMIDIYKQNHVYVWLHANVCTYFWSRRLLEEAWLLFDVVLLSPLPPGSLQVLYTLLLWGCHLQVPLLQMPVWPTHHFSVKKQVIETTCTLQNLNSHSVCTRQTKHNITSSITDAAILFVGNQQHCFAYGGSSIEAVEDPMPYLWSGLNRASVRGRTSFNSGQSSFSSMANLVKP